MILNFMEIEMRLTSAAITKGKRKKYHFELHQINYEKEVIEKEIKKKQQEFDYAKKGYIELQSQVEETEKEAEYTSLAGEISLKNTLIHYHTYTIDEIVNKIYAELKLREWEGNILKLPTGMYSKENLPPKEDIKKLIRSSMDRVGIKGNRLIEKNKLNIESSFNTLLRKTGKTTVYERKAKEPFTISTATVEKESISVGALRHNATVFYSSDYANELDVEDRDILSAISRETGDFILLSTPLE